MNQMFEEKIEEKIKELQDNGVSVFVLDTAHGHQKTMIQAISKLRGLVKEEIVIIAGNVCTAEATEDLIKVGANGVKV
jgi:IMP dehydrogenase